MAMIANQQTTIQFLMTLMERERKHSTEREHETWRRAEVEKRESREHASAAIQSVMRTKIVAKSVNEGKPQPVQQVMPFATNGASRKQFRPGVDDSATP